MLRNKQQKKLISVERDIVGINVILKNYGCFKIVSLNLYGIKKALNQPLY